MRIVNKKVLTFALSIFSISMAMSYKSITCATEESKDPQNTTKPQPLHLAEENASTKSTDKVKRSLIFSKEKQNKNNRPWVVQDSMAVRYVALDPRDPFFTVVKNPRPIGASPDGMFFFLVVCGGDLVGDTDLCTLVVYRTSQVDEWLARRGTDPPPPALRFVSFRSRSSTVSALSDPRWDEDGRSIVFQATSNEMTGDAFRLDVYSGRLEQLSRMESPLSRIPWIVARGAGSLHAESVFGPTVPARYPVEWVARNPDGSIASSWSLGARNSDTILFAGYRGRPMRRIPLDAQIEAGWLSPDGSVGIVRARGRTGNQPAARPSLVSIDTLTGSANVLAMGSSYRARYRGTARPMPFSEAFWSEDGTRAILINVTLLKQRRTGSLQPAIRVDENEGKDGIKRIGEDASDERETAARTQENGSGFGGARLASSAEAESSGAGSTDDVDPSLVEPTADEAIVEYNVTSGLLKQLEPLQVESQDTPQYVSEAGWLKPGQELLVMHETGQGKSNGTVYSFTPMGVTARVVDSSLRVPTRVSELAGGLKVRVDQGANAPPRVVASRGTREGVLLDLNPQLKILGLQKTEDFEWREPDGQVTIGGLTLPAGYRKGRRVPLVIHAYHYLPESFLPDGFARATDAVQALAARGIAVLQLEIPIASAAKPREGAQFVERIDSAVEELVRRGIVDPKRVGATGFSHGGYEVLYAVTHPGRVPLAAAMCADFYQGSYPEYLRLGAYFKDSIGSLDDTLGGRFWGAQSQWLQDETTFNVNQSVTPLLMTSHGYDPRRAAPSREENGVESVIGAFVLNDKPFEYLYFGYSGHQLRRPLERIASQEAMIDWMSFWLQGYEDPSPEKAQQYRRWRPLRQQQAKSLDSASSFR